MFYYWSGGLYEIPFSHIAQYCATAPDGRVIVEYYKPDTFERILQYHSPSWKPFKYFTVDGEVFEHLSQECLYTDRSFEYRDAKGRTHFGSKDTKFMPISPAEAAKDAEYFLNLNTDDPWPLSNSDNKYWDGVQWCGDGSHEGLFWDDNDCHIMIPFSEIPEVLRSFEVICD